MKLTYFNVYGRVEMIRMLLSFAKVEYTEESVSFEDWMTNPDIKNSVEFG